MVHRIAGLGAVLMLGSASAQNVDVRVADVAQAPLPRSVELGGKTYVDHGLVATGSLPAGTIDFLGDTLGSFSSLAIEPGSWKRDGDTYTGVLWTLPDRGRNDPEHNVFFDYRGRLHRFRFSMKVWEPARKVWEPAAPAIPAERGNEAASQPVIAAEAAPTSGAVSLQVDGGLELRDLGGKPFTGAEPGKGVRKERGIVLPSPASGIGEGKVSLDAESLQFTRDGGFYVGDEYAANVYRFDAKGKLTGIIVPPKAVRPLDADGKPDFTSLKPPVTGRRNNQGVEGMALSPDGTRLFVVLQSALIQDAEAREVPADASGRSLARVLVYDVSHGGVPKMPVGHYVVRLPVYADRGDGGAPNKTAAQSEIRVLDNHTFLMLARDGNGLGAEGGKPIVYKSVLLVDTDGASNLSGTTYETSTTSVLGGDGKLRDDIRVATWKPLVNLLDPTDLARFGLGIEGGRKDTTQLSEKWEAMDLVPALDPTRPDDWFLLVGNDNDFIAKHCVMDGQGCDSAIDNDNRILVYRLTLPGMRSTAASNHR
ncbi:phytase-like protein with esterase activity [Luteibacter sp. OK325]|uniref:esterase-like activity of phytase family protein n=1 Tax=Luteibacter sp. OK325 TaxID=2135670 RepID=UPI000D4E0B49|nr:esterase-like activity of phytase family protein [Luteibacter sp. OK325]PTR34955.1 phytase-like protein with esterase activity [Luteibacter sp. OK325]